MSENKKSVKDVTLLEVGALGIIGSAVFAPFYPPGAIVSLGLGVSCIASYVTTWSKFDRLFKGLNLCKNSAYPILKQRKKTDYSTVYKFTLPAGLSTDDFDKYKLAIEQYVGRDIDIKYTYKQVWIEVFEKELKSKYDYECTACTGNMEFPVGYNRKGEIITCDLSSGEPHMLIAGETGSGKSTVLRSIITNLILQNKVKLHLIDLKRGAEFQIFSRCKNVVSFGRTRTEAEQVLNQISAEVDRRYDLFYDNNVVDIKEYNKKIGRLGYELLVIDEFADLKADKASISVLEELAAKARACGIHILISTQRPDANVLNGRIKANVTTVLGLKTHNDINSRIIIGSDGLERLRGAGHGIFLRGSKETVQCPYLSTDRARELIRDTYINKPKIIKQTDIKDFGFLDVI